MFVVTLRFSQWEWHKWEWRSRLCPVSLPFGPSFFPQRRDLIHGGDLERPREPFSTRPHARELHVIQ